MLTLISIGLIIATVMVFKRYKPENDNYRLSAIAIFAMVTAIALAFNVGAFYSVTQHSYRTKVVNNYKATISKLEKEIEEFDEKNYDDFFTAIESSEDKYKDLDELIEKRLELQKELDKNKREFKNLKFGVSEKGYRINKFLLYFGS